MALCPTDSEQTIEDLRSVAANWEKTRRMWYSLGYEVDWIMVIITQIGEGIRIIEQGGGASWQD
jgi:hypothetical protein